MKILIKPSDIVKRSLWRKYVDYVLEDKSEENQRAVLEKDEEFYIDERDALVIDLLRVIETPNLSYKLNQKILDLINHRSIKNKSDGKFYINKRGLLKILNYFEKNFPEGYESNDREFDEGIKILKKYCSDFTEKIEKIDITTIKMVNIQMECLPINKVKKAINMFV